MPYIVQDSDEFRLTLYSHDSTDQAGLVGFRVRTNYLIGAGATDEGVVDKLSGVWGPRLKFFFTTDTQYMGATLRRLFGVGAQPITRFSVSGSGAGTEALPTLPLQTAGLLSFATDTGGKKYRGRCYIPFVARSYQTSSTSGDPSVAFQTQMETIGAAVVAGDTIIVGGATISVEYGLHPVGDPVWSKYTSYKYHDRWATQRRRGSFGKQNPFPFN